MFNIYSVISALIQVQQNALDAKLFYYKNKLEVQVVNLMTRSGQDMIVLMLPVFLWLKYFLKANKICLIIFF